MPELPEVETIARAVRDGGHLDPERKATPSLVGRKIIECHTLWERTLAEPSPAVFRARIVGQSIEQVNRRGKFLVFQLTQDNLLIHLRMSGDLIVSQTHEPFGTHFRLVLDLDRGLRLAFNDPRKFGRAWLLSDTEQVLGRLGPEPLDPSFTAQDLFHRLTQFRRQLKPLLLDQHFLAGLGNIYVDEALHEARLHPQIPSNLLTRSQVEQLWSAIRAVLSKGIHRQGASIDWVYRGGDFQNEFHVYRRTGEPCNRCNTPISRILVGQRGTHFCPYCQPAWDTP
jgi:formamidopyrimidine-DNA glycosylase